ncbi:hypothetical protein [Phytoactinopolyspora limicola]|uniref:hypothetical protein n=1 Tax=Phytoactinopolyspora limicola TaxID=2715536 RepID=UPI001409A1E2|nr:hypothetical protein [Phytoactinopolyspora limicola]
MTDASVTPASAAARVALGGDGEALLEPAAFGLFLGGDPDVGDGGFPPGTMLILVCSRTSNQDRL